ncbi:CbtA family protein [Halorientalis salina]|uniref:CbtA family protein n=1 Tax=Halorientalis salina TaxID=2932266 RepID=UPI0010ACA90B|nr:CbtA family protein [Halorientalis salina]
MLQQYLLRGLKAGLVAGLVLGLFVALVANPVVGMAEGLAGDHGHGAANAGDGHHGAEHESAVSTATTKAVSVLGGVFWALLLGVVTFGVAFYFLEPAIPGAGDTQSYLLAAAGFVTVSGAPWLVLPPQPPGVEQAFGTDLRIAIYGGMMVAGLLACGIAGYAYTHLRERGRPVALAGAVAPFCLLVGAAVLAPANPVEVAVPETVVTGFRALVIFNQAMVWVVLASAHAWLLRRERSTAATETSNTGYAEPTPTAD